MDHGKSYVDKKWKAFQRYPGMKRHLTMLDFKSATADLQGSSLAWRPQDSG